MYDGPNLLDRSSVVNLGNVCLPRFTFGCFYCTPGFGTDDPVVFHIGGSRLLFFHVLSKVASHMSDISVIERRNGSASSAHDSSPVASGRFVYVGDLESCEVPGRQLATTC